MTRKDFELIASSIRKHGRSKEVLIIDLAVRFEAEYPLFNRERFLAACDGTKRGQS